jgi:starch phosphorylase
MKKDNLLQEFLSYARIDKFQEHYSQDIADGKYFGMPLASIVQAERKLRQNGSRSVAYFSMEYGLASSFYNSLQSKARLDYHNKIPSNTIFSNYRLADYFFDIKMEYLMDLPIYSGGLGVLAGDTLKTMADYKMPALGIGILWHSGYFKQSFWFKYGQVPEKNHWHPRVYPGLIPLKNAIKIRINGETVHLKLWKYYVFSYKRDYAIPLILLDSESVRNSDQTINLTDQLYRAEDARIKIMQRLVLGFGGVVALKELGYNVEILHLNEGHAAFAFIEKCRGLSAEEIEKTKARFAYTCHTPVEAGHDRFSREDLKSILTEEDFALTQKFGQEKTGLINLTLLAMNTSSSINAVSKNHQRVMSSQFPHYKERIRYITNGVHPYTWISEEFIKVFNNFSSVLENVEANPMVLTRAGELKKNQDFRRQVWQAHQANKTKLCNLLGKWGFKQDVFTLCWARRIAAYKRPSLILQDTEQLINIAKNAGPLQIILAGKAHPKDNLGFTYINELLDKVDTLVDVYDKLKIVILENYDIYLGKMLTSGVDVWLNNPLPPFEASGTSGMKAILNAVVQLTTLDGWVVEAADKGVGRIFGYTYPGGSIGTELQLHMQDDSKELYKALEETVKLYYQTNNQGDIELSSGWIDTMIDCVAAGSYFNTYRMLDEYKHSVWKIS